MSYPHVKSFFLTWSLHNVRRIRLGPCPKLIFFTCSTQQEVVPTTINAPFDSGDAAAGGSRTQSSSFKTTWLHNSYICSAGHHTLLTLGSWQAKARLMSSLIAVQVYNVKWSSEGRLEKCMSENGKLYCNANYFHLSLPCHVFHTICFCFATFMILWFVPYWAVLVLTLTTITHLLHLKSDVFTWCSEADGSLSELRNLFQFFYTSAPFKMVKKVWIWQQKVSWVYFTFFQTEDAF